MQTAQIRMHPVDTIFYHIGGGNALIICNFALFFDKISVFLSSFHEKNGSDARVRGIEAAENLYFSITLRNQSPSESPSH